MAVPLRRIDKEIRDVLGLTGWGIWRKRIAQLEIDERRGLAAYSVVRTNPLVPLIREFLGLHKRFKKADKGGSAMRVLSSIAVGIDRIYERLSPEAQERMVSCLRADMPAPFLYEMQIAVYFLANGYDVDFVDLEKMKEHGTFEYLVRKDGFEGEIECKHVSTDAGRKITRQAFRLLVDEIKQQYSDLKGSYECCLVCDSRLNKNVATLRAIASSLGRCIPCGELRVDDVSVRVVRGADNVPKHTEADLDRRRHGYGHIAIIRSKESTIILRADSEEEDTVLDAIRDQIKKAARQLSGTRPGLVSCFIEGVRDQDWQQLSEGTKLSAMTLDFLDDSSRGHVYAVAYSSEPVLRRAPGVSELMAGRLIFTNECCVYPVAEDAFLTERSNP